MNDPFAFLSEEEVEQIASLVEVLEKSTFDFLQVEARDLKLILSKGQGAPTPVAPSPADPTSAPDAAAAALAAAASAGSTAAAAPGPAATESRADDGTVVIAAPMVGRFYAQAEPGAPPFVTVGSEVDVDTTVGLIEVMKVFNAVRAGGRGVITAVCVDNAQFVEYGQTLFRMRPL